MSKIITNNTSLPESLAPMTSEPQLTQLVKDWKISVSDDQFKKLVMGFLWNAELSALFLEKLGLDMFQNQFAHKSRTEFTNALNKWIDDGHTVRDLIIILVHFDRSPLAKDLGLLPLYDAVKAELSKIR